MVYVLLNALFCCIGLESRVRYEVMVISGTLSGFPPVDDNWPWYPMALGEVRPPNGKHVHTFPCSLSNWFFCKLTMHTFQPVINWFLTLEVYVHKLVRNLHYRIKFLFCYHITILVLQWRRSPSFNHCDIYFIQPVSYGIKFLAYQAG